MVTAAISWHASEWGLKASASSGEEHFPGPLGTGRIGLEEAEPPALEERYTVFQEAGLPQCWGLQTRTPFRRPLCLLLGGGAGVNLRRREPIASPPAAGRWAGHWASVAASLHSLPERCPVISRAALGVRFLATRCGGGAANGKWGGAGVGAKGVGRHKLGVVSVGDGVVGKLGDYVG